MKCLVLAPVFLLFAACAAQPEQKVELLREPVKPRTQPAVAGG